MEPTESPENTPRVESAAEYRRRYGRTMMVLTRLKGKTAAPDELCRITSVNTIAPDLWVTVQFLDGSSRSFRPDMIEPVGRD
jgi:hypothetical protein